MNVLLFMLLVAQATILVIVWRRIDREHQRFLDELNHFLQQSEAGMSADLVGGILALASLAVAVLAAAFHVVQRERSHHGSR